MYFFVSVFMSTFVAVLVLLLRTDVLPSLIDNTVLAGTAHSMTTFYFFVFVIDCRELPMLLGDIPVALVEVGGSDIFIDLVLTHIVLQVNTGLNDWDHLSFADETTISSRVHGRTCEAAREAVIAV